MLLYMYVYYIHVYACVRVRAHIYFYSAAIFTFHKFVRGLTCGKAYKMKPALIGVLGNAAECSFVVRQVAMLVFIVASWRCHQCCCWLMVLRLVRIALHATRFWWPLNRYIDVVFHSAPNFTQYLTGMWTRVSVCVCACIRSWLSIYFAQLSLSL